MGGGGGEVLLLGLFVCLSGRPHSSTSDLDYILQVGVEPELGQSSSKIIWNRNWIANSELFV